MANPTPKIAYIEASWHKDILSQARETFVNHMVSEGRSAEDVVVFDVPGAYEIPLVAKKLAQSGDYAAIVACGLVVDGGIYRHDFVAQAVIEGMMQVQLETGVPVLSVVLTPHHFHDHDEHKTYYHRHFAVKGQEAAHAALQVIRLHQQI